MKILVCIKAVPDPEGRVTIDETGRGVRFEGTWRMNRFDEYALEEALRIGEAIPLETIDALSVGPGGTASTIKRALELGATEGIHIVTGENTSLGPFQAASLIASFARPRRYDLILAGVMGEDRMYSQTGPMIAELLHYPWASSVIHEEIDAQAETVSLEREIEAGSRECLEMRLPALLTVQPGINRPRYPALSNVLRARAQELTTIDARDMGTPDPRETTQGYRYPAAPSKGTFLEGTREEKARALLGILHERGFL